MKRHEIRVIELHAANYPSIPSRFGRALQAWFFRYDTQAKEDVLVDSRNFREITETSARRAQRAQLALVERGRG